MFQYDFDDIYNIKIYNIIKLCDGFNNAIVNVEKLTHSIFININVIYILHFIFQNLIVIKIIIIIKET